MTKQMVNLNQLYASGSISRAQYVKAWAYYQAKEGLYDKSNK